MKLMQVQSQMKVPNKQYASKDVSPSRNESPLKPPFRVNHGAVMNTSLRSGEASLNMSVEKTVNPSAVKFDRVAPPQATFNSQASHKRVKSLPYNLPKMRPDVIKQVDLSKKPVHVDMNKTEQSKHWN